MIAVSVVLLPHEATVSQSVRAYYNDDRRPSEDCPESGAVAFHQGVLGAL